MARQSQTELMAEAVASAVKRHVASETKTLIERLDELETRLDGVMRFRGSFQKAERYERGDCAVSDGGLWYCLRTVDGSAGRPGTDEAASSWQLTSKTR